MRSPTLSFRLAPLFLSLSYSALAEPPWQVPYVDPTTGRCGLYRDGFKDEERTPLDRRFARLSLPTQPNACKALLDQVLAYPQGLRTPAMVPPGEAATEPACERLASSLPASPEHTCRALGYRYVGELPASSRPCYPKLAPFLGARCAPLIWIHLAVLIAAASCSAALGYVIFKRRSERRRALAAAADTPAPPEPHPDADRQRSRTGEW